MQRLAEEILTTGGGTQLRLTCGHKATAGAMPGTSLNCRACDRFEIPADYVAYKRTPEFTEQTVPAGLLKDHRTKPGVWGVIHVVSGRLRYVIDEWNWDQNLSPAQSGIVIPELLHFVQPIGPVSFFVEFLRAPS